MKLLRLVSDDKTGIFDVQFNEEITITPNSKMALHSLSFEQLIRQLVIDSDNDEITISYSNALSITKKLTHKTYTADNVDFLLDELKQVLNQTGIITNTNQIGIEWNVEKNQKNKIQIYYKKNPSLKEFKNSKSSKIDYASGLYRVSAGATNGYIASTDYMPLGCGYIRAQCRNRFDGNVIIGLSIFNPDNEPYQLGNIKYGILIEQNTGLCKYINNGVATSSGITSTDINDVFEVAISGGKIVCNLYRNSQPAAENILTVGYDNNTKLYPYLNITGGDSNRVAMSYIYSPFSNTLKAQSEYIDTSALVGVKPPSRTNIDSIQYVEFESIEIAEFLGFKNKKLETQKTTEYNTTADDLFLLNSYNDSFIVELLDLKLDSYDTQKKGRVNILAVVPSAELNENLTSGVVYEASNLLFINLKNYQELQLRNLRLRVLQRDFTPINLKGLGVMCLLVKDKDE